jgi:uncharacterized protein (DUF1684 family)
MVSSIVTGALTSADVTDDAVHLKEINEWHKARIDRLRSEEGWLTLAGLMLLEEGENTFGSAANNDLVFPKKAPRRAGVITLKDGSVSIEAADGITITSGSEPVSSMALLTDAAEKPTVLDMDSFRFYVIERSGRHYVRLKDRESKILKEFTGIDRFPVDTKWRIEGHFELYDPQKTITVPNALGFETEEECYGIIVFEMNGKVHRLEPMGKPTGTLFIVYGDETNGVETYGGGRFLTAGPPEPDGKIIIDFNKSYNPPCAFTPYATCPLPHTYNILEARIEAGEKKYGKGTH